MLRRNPTTIALTQADLDLYEANRQRKLWEKQQQQQQQQQQQASSQSTESSEKTQEKEKGKKERILGDRRN
jgi:hypothetical protein